MICNNDGIIISECPGCHGLPKHHAAGSSSAAWHSARNRRCSASRARCHASVDVGGTYMNIRCVWKLMYFKRQYFAPELPVLSILVDVLNFKIWAQQCKAAYRTGKQLAHCGWLPKTDVRIELKDDERCMDIWIQQFVEWWGWQRFQQYITDIHWYHEW